MAAIPLGMQEYLFTLGILASLAGVVIAAAKSRKDIRAVLSGYGLNRMHILFMLGVVLAFVVLELVIVKPTQQLFFDDAIYQAMALDLLHTGQAWMCNYGTTASCFSGEIFHEPIGESFNLAIGFLILGVHRYSAYYTNFAQGAIAVAFTYLSALVLFGKRRIALLSALFIAMSPVMLVWAMPTASDMPMLAYSLIAIFCMLIFLRKKTLWTFGMALFSLSLLTYMKVDAVVYLVAIPLMYVVLDDKSIMASIKANVLMVKENLFNTRALVMFLVFAMAISPELGFAHSELVGGSFGFQGAYVQESCNTQYTIIAKSAINLQNFGANICSNLFFWFDAYKSDYVMQPIIFTAFGIFGAISMFILGRRRELLALGIWFLAFFLLYTAFYAGSVTYGVDWRFMLSLIAQASIFAGFGAAALMSLGSPRRKKTDDRHAL